MITNALIPKSTLSRRHRADRLTDSPSLVTTGPEYLGRHADFAAVYPAVLVPAFEAALARQRAGFFRW